MSARTDNNDANPPEAALKRDLERQLRAQLATVTGGLAPDDYMQAWWDWYFNLTKQPDKQLALVQSAFQKALDTWQFAASAATGLPAPAEQQVPGFGDPAWNVWPFNVYAKSYVTWAAWLQEAVAAGSMGPDRSAARLRFATQQVLDAASPANFLHTNPELLNKTVAESGQNLVRGLKNWLEDAERMLSGKRSRLAQFEVGKDVAVTPGKVIFRNRLIEVLQYSPQTDSVYAEPVLITPAWIMKYYILDLSPRNSLVRYLVEKGHTVFMISWKNPTSVERDLGMDDYVQLGFKDALEAVNRIVPERKVHAVGYCIGGTLLSVAAALLGARADQRLASVSLLAALTDFSEPGELSVFISPSQLAMLEAVMSKAGVLESERMGAAFMLLRSKDLLWTPAVNSYLRGERARPNDLMAWNQDGTRMPWRMHTEYLERLYLKNELARGQFTVGGERVDLKSLRVPMFVVGTETDHVAPWRSVFKLRGLTRSADYTFLLTSGGHNAGIVSGPVHPKRRHRVLGWTNDTDSLTPDEWLRAAPCQPDSWWPAWQRWLAERSDPRRQPPPLTGTARTGTQPELEDAPGRYVRE
ncbi:MAG: PHA/PHB synthase family protein [Steroidobacteraceae bacterium]